MGLLYSTRTSHYFPAQSPYFLVEVFQCDDIIMEKFHKNNFLLHTVPPCQYM
jgi:hypothetical protein